MKNKKIEEEIFEYFENQNIPELKDKQTLLKAVELNKKRRKVMVGKRITIFAYSFCLILLTLIPIITLTYNKETPDNSSQPTIYYGNDEATKIDLTKEETKSYIDNYFPQYSFIFDDYTCNELAGYYIPNTDKILALNIHANDINIPFIAVEINLIISNQFIFNEHDSYIKDSELIQTNEYSMNKLVFSNRFEEYLKAYISYPSHKIYLNFNVINEELLNRFI